MLTQVVSPWRHRPAPSITSEMGAAGDHADVGVIAPAGGVADSPAQVRKLA